MTLKKKITVLLMGAMMTAAAAYASVAPQQVALDGISPGMSLEQAKSIGGEVVYTDYERIVFKSGVIVKTDDKRPNIVEDVEIKNGSAQTPGGIKVGMAAEKLTEVYGQADKVDQDRDDTEYIYRSDDGTKKMEFKVKNGVIVKISCELRD